MLGAPDSRGSLGYLKFILRWLDDSARSSLSFGGAALDGRLRRQFQRPTINFLRDEYNPTETVSVSHLFTGKCRWHRAFEQSGRGSSVLVQSDFEALLGAVHRASEIGWL